MALMGQPPEFSLDLGWNHQVLAVCRNDWLWLCARYTKSPVFVSLCAWVGLLVGCMFVFVCSGFCCGGGSFVGFLNNVLLLTADLQTHTGSGAECAPLPALCSGGILWPE